MTDFAETEFVCGPLWVTLDGREVRVAGQVVKLLARDYDVLAALVANVHRMLSREQLLSICWPDAKFMLKLGVWSKC